MCMHANVKNIHVKFASQTTSVGEQYKQKTYIHIHTHTYIQNTQWEGHEELPELNVENKEVRDYLFEVGKFWLSEVWRCIFVSQAMYICVSNDVYLCLK